mgnify:CR=1 FL=1
MQFARLCGIAAAALLTGALAAQAQQADKVRFGTNWVAEAEHGGFYQGLADGTYKKYGLDVTIVPGGPNVNNRILLPVGKLDFFMSANTLQSFDAVEHDIPTVVVAASFQKDPQVLIAHDQNVIERTRPTSLRSATMSCWRSSAFSTTRAASSPLNLLNPSRPPPPMRRSSPASAIDPCPPAE